MTAIETAVKKNEGERTGSSKLELKVGDLFSKNGKNEIVTETTITETYSGEKRLVRFGTAKRKEDGGIAESIYSINKGTGEEHEDYSGIVYGNEHPPFHASERYFELNKFLKEHEK